ncbi:hypothetical protein [Vaginella massiliensis]|uniref:hypothetical protein n=1 Tax=Vaginella massiliensis TaxID=1816680 RepID=UPI001F3D29AF|nr:hypothetical protein [Vaginella massiliensis]
MSDAFNEEFLRHDDRYIWGGFVETAFRKNPMMEEKSRAWYINPIQLQYLEKNVRFLKNKNIPYIIIQAPITNRLYNSRTNSDEVDSILNTYGRYKNFQKLIDLNDTLDFYDSNHLNQQAVEKFNEIFIDYIKNQNLL